MVGVKVGGTGWALLLFLLSLVACLQRIVADCRSLVSVRLSNTAIADVVEEVSAAMEARDAGKDAFRLGVVAGTIPFGHDWPIAAEHVHGCGYLQERTGLELIVLKFSV